VPDNCERIRFGALARTKEAGFALQLANAPAASFVAGEFLFVFFSRLLGREGAMFSGTTPPPPLTVGVYAVIDMPNVRRTRERSPKCSFEHHAAAPLS
jgi:hypothetical protein